MLLQTIEALFRKYRLFCYQKLFAAVREKPGSLSATEAFSADIIHLLGSPTISQFAETIGIRICVAVRRQAEAIVRAANGRFCVSTQCCCVIAAISCERDIVLHRYVILCQNILGVAVLLRNCVDSSIRILPTVVIILNEEINGISNAGNTIIRFNNGFNQFDWQRHFDNISGDFCS